MQRTADASSAYSLELLIGYESVLLASISYEVDRVWSKSSMSGGRLSVEAQLVTGFSYAGDRGEVACLRQARIAQRPRTQTKVEVVLGFKCHSDFLFAPKIDEIHLD